jgi:hypothetical protein
MIDVAKVRRAEGSSSVHARQSRTALTAQSPAWHTGYLRLFPAICRQTRQYLRRLTADVQDDAFEEIVADTVVVYARLVELGKEELAYASPLVMYALRKFRAGRRVGCPLNIRDVMSEHCQRRKHVFVKRLDRFTQQSNEWREVLVADRHASPADIVAMRIDFSEWLRTLTSRNRQIAERLAVGDSSGSVARRFSVSTGRISQLRRELHESWNQFIGVTAN